MDVSIALAKIFGIYFAVIGFSLMINHRFFKGVLQDLVQSNIAMLIIATITLIFGSILVVLHNVWVVDWRLSITLLCWLTFFAGVVRTLFPTFIQRMARKLFTTARHFHIAGTASIAIGLAFIYLGFM